MSGQLEGTAIPDDKWFVPGWKVPLAEGYDEPVTVGMAIGDLPRLKGHLNGEIPQEQRLPLRKAPSKYVQQLRSWPDMLAKETVSGNWYRNTPRDFETFKRMAQGDKYPQAIEIANLRFSEHVKAMSNPPKPDSADWVELRKKFVPPYRNDAFDDKWHKLHMDRPSWTVTAHLEKDTYSHIHFDSRQARTVTIREAARLQSFPDAIDFCGNFGEQYRQIGNAVPPMLSRAIALNLIEQLDGLHQ